jgi:hypothetical protein
VLLFPTKAVYLQYKLAIYDWYISIPSAIRGVRVEPEAVGLILSERITALPMPFDMVI